MVQHWYSVNVLLLFFLQFEIFHSFFPLYSISVVSNWFMCVCVCVYQVLVWFRSCSLSLSFYLYCCTCSFESNGIINDYFVSFLFLFNEHSIYLLHSFFLAGIFFCKILKQLSSWLVDWWFGLDTNKQTNKIEMQSLVWCAFATKILLQYLNKSNNKKRMNERQIK